MKFDHYTIRLIGPDDLEGYFNLVNNNRNRLEDFFAGTVKYTANLESTRDYLAKIVEQQRDRTHYSFVVVDDLTSTIIGSAQVKNIDWSIPKAEIGYYVDRAYEGRGIVSRATGMVIDFSLNELKMSKLLIRAHQANIASRKVAEKNGFRLEGIITRDYKTTRGEVVDLMYYGLVNE